MDISSFKTPIKNQPKQINSPIESSLTDEESFTDISLAQAQLENTILEQKLKAQRLLLEEKTKQKMVRLIHQLKSLYKNF